MDTGLFHSEKLRSTCDEMQQQHGHTACWQFRDFAPDWYAVQTACTDQEASGPCNDSDNPVVAWGTQSLEPRTAFLTCRRKDGSADYVALRTIEISGQQVFVVSDSDED